jgi:hypothetical protein
MRCSAQALLCLTESTIFLKRLNGLQFLLLQSAILAVTMLDATMLTRKGLKKACPCGDGYRRCPGALSTMLTFSCSLMPTISVEASDDIFSTLISPSTSAFADNFDCTPQMNAALGYRRLVPQMWDPLTCKSPLTTTATITYVATNETPILPVLLRSPCSQPQGV